MIIVMTSYIVHMPLVIKLSSGGIAKPVVWIYLALVVWLGFIPWNSFCNLALWSCTGFLRVAGGLASLQLLFLHGGIS